MADSMLRARWSRLAALGLAMVGLAPFLMVAAALIWGLDVGEELPFFVALFVLPWVAAFLAWRFGTWSKIVAIVVALAGVGMLFWTAFGLALPSSFFDFVPGVLVIPGALIAIIASIAAMVAKRRGHMVAAREGGERRAINVVVAVVSVLAVASGVLTVTSRATVDAADAAAEVSLSNFKYTQDSYSVPGGSQIVVRNEDPFHHTFTIEALDIDVEFGPNSAKVIDIPAQAGTYVVYCRPHTVTPDDPGEDDMWSTFTVE